MHWRDGLVLACSILFSCGRYFSREKYQSLASELGCAFEFRPPFCVRARSDALLLNVQRGFSREKYCRAASGPTQQQEEWV